MALAILSIGMMGIMQMLATTQAKNFRGRETTNAMVAVQEVTESLMAYDYDGPTLVDTTSGVPYNVIVENGRSSYNVSYTVTEGSWGANTPMPLTKRIHLQVEFAATNLRQKTRVEAYLIMAEFGKR